MDASNEKGVEDDEQHEREEDKEEDGGVVVDALVGGILAELTEGDLHSGEVGARLRVLVDDPLKGRRQGDGHADDEDAEDDPLGTRLRADDLPLDGVTDGDVPGNAWEGMMFQKKVQRSKIKGQICLLVL